MTLWKCFDGFLIPTIRRKAVINEKDDPCDSLSNPEVTNAFEIVTSKL